jgi:hypothetical protein
VPSRIFVNMKIKTTLFCCLSVLALAQDIPEDVKQSVTKLINMTRAWDSKANSPGISTEIREVSRGTDGALTVRYHLYVKGSPIKGMRYSLISWPINARDPQEVMGGITLKDDGLAICAGREADECGDPNKKDDPIEFTVMPAKAELYRMALISADRQTKAYFQVVPEPIANEDRGCKIQVVRLLPKFEVTLLKLTGFPSNEDVQINSQSYDEKKDFKMHSDVDGAALQALLPAVKGKTSGKTEIRATSEKCSPKLSFEWGK